MEPDFLESYDFLKEQFDPETVGGANDELFRRTARRNSYRAIRLAVAESSRVRVTPTLLLAEIHRRFTEHRLLAFLQRSENRSSSLVEEIRQWPEFATLSPSQERMIRTEDASLLPYEIRIWHQEWVAFVLRHSRELFTPDSAAGLLKLWKDHPEDGDLTLAAVSLNPDQARMILTRSCEVHSSCTQADPRVVAALAKDHLLSESQLLEDCFFSPSRSPDERVTILRSFEPLRHRGLLLLRQWFGDPRFERLLFEPPGDSGYAHIEDRELRKLSVRDRHLETVEELLNAIVNINQVCNGKLQPLTNPLDRAWRRRKYGKYGSPSPEEERKVLGENNLKREKAVRECVTQIRAWLAGA
jgi:hypothetical protein